MLEEMVVDMLKKIKEKFFKTTPGVVAFFENEKSLLNAAKVTYDSGYRNFDTISPFPVHGMDDVMRLKRSIVPWVTFSFGVLGCAFGTWFQYWTSAVNYPVNIAGKPFFSLPAFVPIIFELTVLFAGLATFVSILFLCKLPKINPPILDVDLTCHKFALLIFEVDKKYESANKSLEFLNSLNCTEAREYLKF